jgi:hypothetical protein
MSLIAFAANRSALATFTSNGIRLSGETAMKGRRLTTAMLAVLSTLTPIAGEADDAGPGPAAAGLTFCCAADNDLFKSLVTGRKVPPRYDSPTEAVRRAPLKSGVLILADSYPAAPTEISGGLLKEATAKNLRLFIEYPAAIPGIKFGAPRGIRWERLVVASDDSNLGLPKMHLLALHDCQVLPAESANPLLVIARVAGFDTAVYGLPKEKFPILFETENGVLISTTKLSNYVTARYAPFEDWLTVWRHILSRLDPAGSPHKLVAKPVVRPAYREDEPLPANAEELAVARFAHWLRQSRLLVPKDRAPQFHEQMRAGVELGELPPADAPVGDGSLGILEGYASQIKPDGSQMQRLPIRADCQAESAATLALHASLSGDRRSRQIAKNLLDFLYFESEMHRGDRGNAKHPAFGMISWGAIAPAWQVANYGDDNARTLLATMAASASLDSNAWDASMLKALLANLRTTGKLGFRGDRIDMPQIQQHGWRHYHDSETVNYSPHFEAYLWACYLWAFDKTGEQEFLEKSKVGIRMMIDAYPSEWRWGDDVERAHMLLPLAWLIRVEDTPEHRKWLKRVSDDLLAHQTPCGAIPVRLRGTGAGHYLVPSTNEAYGTSETPLIQKNGDPVSDQLYTVGFALLGLREAIAATGDGALKAAEDRLAEYVVRIQVRSESLPYLEGTWFRAFDFDRWDYWGSSADMGWGVWCAEAGWGPAWNGIALALRPKHTSLWDLPAGSKLNDHLGEIKKLMGANDGSPWRE